MQVGYVADEAANLNLTNCDPQCANDELCVENATDNTYQCEAIIVEDTQNNIGHLWASIMDRHSIQMDMSYDSVNDVITLANATNAYDTLIFEEGNISDIMIRCPLGDCHYSVGFVHTQFCTDDTSVSRFNACDEIMAVHDMPIYDYAATIYNITLCGETYTPFVGAIRDSTSSIVTNSNGFTHRANLEMAYPEFYDVGHEIWVSRNYYGTGNVSFRTYNSTGTQTGWKYTRDAFLIQLRWFVTLEAQSNPIEIYYAEYGFCENEDWEASEETGYICQSLGCVNGTPNNRNQCDCDEHWTEDYCDELDCMNGTYNSDTESCDCYNDWTGIVCNNEILDCVNGQFNTETYECDCNWADEWDRWQGTLCDSLDCVYGTFTNGDARCNCNLGYEEIRCDKLVTAHPETVDGTAEISRYIMYPSEGLMFQENNIEYCSNKGLSLPRFFNQDEHDQWASDYTSTDHLIQYPNYWLGMEHDTNHTGDYKDGFYWLGNNGEIDLNYPLSIDHWSVLEPTGGSHEVCAVTGYTSDWSDDGCDSDRSVACEVRKLYHFYPSLKVDYTDAATFCQTHNMQLATFYSEEQYVQFVLEFFDIDLAEHDTAEYWIGAQSSNGEFYWVDANGDVDTSKSLPTTYEAWSSGLPNGSGDCAYFYNNVWFDSACDGVTKQVVCQQQVIHEIPCIPLPYDECKPPSQQEIVCDVDDAPEDAIVDSDNACSDQSLHDCSNDEICIDTGSLTYECEAIVTDEDTTVVGNIFASIMDRHSIKMDMVYNSTKDRIELSNASNDYVTFIIGLSNVMDIYFKCPDGNCHYSVGFVHQQFCTDDTSVSAFNACEEIMNITDMPMYDSINANVYWNVTHCGHETTPFVGAIRDSTSGLVTNSEGVGYNVNDKYPDEISYIDESNVLAVKRKYRDDKEIQWRTHTSGTKNKNLSGFKGTLDGLYAKHYYFVTLESTSSPVYLFEADMGFCDDEIYDITEENGYICTNLDCNGHGTPNNNNRCDCDENWIGSNTSYCDRLDCVNGEFDFETETCTCDRNWYGEICDSETQ